MYADNSAACIEVLLKSGVNQELMRKSSRIDKDRLPEQITRIVVIERDQSETRVENVARVLKQTVAKQ